MSEMFGDIEVVEVVVDNLLIWGTTGNNMTQGWTGFHLEFFHWGGGGGGGGGKL